MPQDYVLRLLQQLGAILATIRGKREAGDLEGAVAEINEQCLRTVGLPLVVVKQAPVDHLDSLLAMSGAQRLPRMLILAELLRQDGELSELRGNPLHAAESYQRSFHLVAQGLPQLAGEDAAAFRETHAQLAAKLRDLGHAG